MSLTDARRLGELVEKLQEQTSTDATQSAILITLSQLNTYAEKVFEEEERILASTRAAEWKTRKNQHKQLLKQLAHHTEDFKEAPTSSREFLNFLQGWLELAMPEGWQPN